MAFDSQEYLACKNRIEAFLNTSVEVHYPLLEPFKAAIDYSLLGGGKRLRAVLLIKTAEMCGLSDQFALPYGAAMEMIHAYSLIHDDLPAMDNDDYRRGKLSNHKRFDEATAILAGDALLNMAYQLMLTAAIEQKNSLPFLKAAKTIADAAGINGMIGGQVMDISTLSEDFSPERLLFIHEHKTAALIIAAVEAGALLANIDEENLSLLHDFAYHFGMAFQICDDILDKTGDEKLLGKPLGSDEEANKLTFVSLYGLNQAKLLFKEALDYANLSLAKINLNTGFLEKLNESMRERQY